MSPGFAENTPAASPNVQPSMTSISEPLLGSPVETAASTTHGYLPPVWSSHSPQLSRIGGLNHGDGYLESQAHHTPRPGDGLETLTSNAQEYAGEKEEVAFFLRQFSEGLAKAYERKLNWPYMNYG